MKSFEIITKIQIYSITECDDIKKELIDNAKKAAMSAYAPYSGFQVGAAVLLEDNKILRGNNQENAAYTSGLCAERTAIFYANATYPNVAVKAIAIAAYHKGQFTEDICSPCGSCRQVLIEIENRYRRPVKIIMSGEKHIYEVSSIRDLLPLSFDKDSLR